MHDLGVRKFCRKFDDWLGRIRHRLRIHLIKKVDPKSFSLKMWLPYLSDMRSLSCSHCPPCYFTDKYLVMGSTGIIQRFKMSTACCCHFTSHSSLRHEPFRSTTSLRQEFLLHWNVHHRRASKIIDLPHFRLNKVRNHQGLAVASILSTKGLYGRDKR